MPKITIKEYDKTKAGSAAYSNFSVVVPGYINSEIDDNGFDENGVCELIDTDAFETYIGKVPCGDGAEIPAEAPKCEWKAKTFDESDIDLWKTARDSGTLYSVADWRAGETVENGRLKCAVEEDIPVEDGPHAEEGQWYCRGKFTIVGPDDSFDTSTKYVQIKPENVGKDKIVPKHYGNQIAYELLKLGYTVLFKKMDESTSYAGATGIAALGKEEFWKCLKDKATYDFRYVITGLLDDSYGARDQIINLVNYINGAEGSTGRGDCIALVDIDKSRYVGKTSSEAVDKITEAANAITIASKYAAIFAPYVTYVFDDAAVREFGGNKTFPGSFHYLACAARAFSIFNEWYAVAGYARGICDYTIDTVGCKLGEAAIDALEPRTSKNGLSKAVNLIVKIKNNYYLWGNRTAEKLDETDLRASHFLNIRQLCTTIKKEVYVACRRFTFDPNSEELWINFKNAIKPTLEKMKADQGIEDYKFVKVPTTQKAKLVAKIRIVPIEAVEDFDIDLYLEDSLEGITVSDSIGE